MSKLNPQASLALQLILKKNHIFHRPSILKVKDWIQNPRAQFIPEPLKTMEEALLNQKSHIQNIIENLVKQYGPISVK
jgi:hypothetical protein